MTQDILNLVRELDDLTTVKLLRHVGPMLFEDPLIERLLDAFPVSPGPLADLTNLPLAQKREALSSDRSIWVARVLLAALASQQRFAEVLAEALNSLCRDELDAEASVPRGLATDLVRLLASAREKAEVERGRVMYSTIPGQGSPLERGGSASDPLVDLAMIALAPEGTPLPVSVVDTTRAKPEKARTPGDRDLEPKENRVITVTGHALDGAPALQFKGGEVYLLRFGVAPPIANNLASGDTQVSDVPKGGLLTHWVVTSTDVAFVAERSNVDVQKIGSTWRAEFELVIPETGSSKTKEVAVVGSAKPGHLLVMLYAVSVKDNREVREVYREVSVRLTDRAEVEADETWKAPQHTHLKTTHEWTTPVEHFQVSIVNDMADISTQRFLLKSQFFSEKFTATNTKLSGLIQNVRSSLENFWEHQKAYLNNLEDSDIKDRLKSGIWKPYTYDGDGWQPLPDRSGAAHKAAFEHVQQTDEWRALASDGYALFDECFPKRTGLRELLEKMLPGSRIDFHWTEMGGGPGWVSHVPWALMYMDEVGGTGPPPDPERFLGLCFRIGTRCWRVQNGSAALGGLDAANCMHLLYWGNQGTIAKESQWQAAEYKQWKHARLLPNQALPDLKKQIILALNTPGPSPVGVLYFYCHCSVGDGAEPWLRFGPQPEDTVGRMELGHRNILDGPLVFANACATAQADPHKISVLEERFFRRGVRAFIGTETRVPDILASKFAWLYFRFFYRLVDPAPMAAGEALTQTRLFLWTQYKNVGGLFYSMANQYDLYLASDQEVRSLRN